MWGVCVSKHTCIILCEFLSMCWFVFRSSSFYCEPTKAVIGSPPFCRAISQSHHAFLRVRFTLQTLLVTLPHPHQRRPPDRRGGILAEIYSPSSLRFRNMLISSNLPPLLPFCVLCVKLANTLMTHLQNFYTCKDKPLQLSQPLRRSTLPVTQGKKVFISYGKIYNHSNQHLSCCLSKPYLTAEGRGS